MILIFLNEKRIDAIFCALILLLVHIEIISQGTVDVRINEFMSANVSALPDWEGDYPDWIELYNNSNDTVYLQNYYLSDDNQNQEKWQIPSVYITPNNFLLLYASGKDTILLNELHLNFKISSSGEPLFFSNQLGEIIDSMLPISLLNNESYGRLGDGDSNLGILTNPTPGYSNNGEQFKTTILFSKPAGYYTEEFDLNLISNDSVYYTLDGSLPNLNSLLYTQPIRIRKSLPNKLSLIPTSPYLFDPDIWPHREFGFQIPSDNIRNGTIIRAQAFKNNVVTSRLYSKTYLSNDHDLSTISIITDSLNLFDHDTGIYVPGVYLDTNNINWTGNYNQRGELWERIGNIEFFSPTNDLLLSSLTGIRIAGKLSRRAPQKSLKLYFRDDYGTSQLDNHFFPSRNYDKIKRLMLRSSFTFWWGRNILFQDDLIHTLVEESSLDIDVQMTHPSVLYINGEYWGIHNIRERQDKHYLQSIYDVDKDSLDIIAGNMHVYEGSADSFGEIVDFVERNDLSIPMNYDYVNRSIDIDNFIDYIILETYFGNYDWPGNNVKLWRSRSPITKWRWLLYDLDATVDDYRLNPFDIFDDGSNAGNPLKIIFTGLLANTTFNRHFIDKYIHHLKTTFLPSNITLLHENFISKYDQEIENHLIRWGQPSDYDSWSFANDYFEDFVQNRPCFIKSFLGKKFENDTAIDVFNCLVNTSDFINLFPNPSTGTITLKFDVMTDLEEVTINIYNRLGQNVYSQALQNPYTEQVNLDFLNSGIYLLNIRSTNLETTKKFVIY